MKYSLRSLMIVAMVLPALLAAGYFGLNDERVAGALAIHPGQRIMI